MKRLSATLLYICGSLAWPLQALAVTPGDPSYRSTNYSINESYIGPGGDIQSNSTSFKQDGSTLGDVGIGNSGSTSFQTNSGFNTTNDPRLSFTVNTPSVDLGVLSTTLASTATATFTVLNYTSYGYAVTMAGPTPSNNGYFLNPLLADTASQNGVEQFGVNTVANTSPSTVGANPVQDVSASTVFGFGRAGTGAATPYAVANNYRYVQGETIASAPKSSGITTFTMTFMANISASTRGGKYTGPMTLIATGTY